jgi:hypothetical protein
MNRFRTAVSTFVSATPFRRSWEASKLIFFDASSDQSRNTGVRSAASISNRNWGR